jgi:hypothetical protein
MTDSVLTPFSNRCDILAQIWVDYKGDPDFEDFISYNDLGLPLAYAIAVEIVSATPKAEMFVNETFELLLSALGVSDDGFESLDDLMIASNAPTPEEG